MKQALLTLVVLLFCLYSFSQILISGEIRPRSEFRYGYNTLRSETGKAAFFVSQRSRINFSFNNEKVSTLVSIHDVRIWGEEPIKSAQYLTVALNESWIKWIINKKLTVKAGRQCIGYDNNRIFGKANWNQRPKKHDAVIISYTNKRWKLDIGNSFNQTSEKIIGNIYYTGTNNYKHLNYAWGCFEDATVRVSGLALIEGFQIDESSTKYRYTNGTNASFKVFKTIKFQISVYYQFGELASNTPISANLTNIEASGKVFNSTLCTGIERTSGHNYEKNNHTERYFATPYGAKHWINGTMDYFKKKEDTGGAGLTDCYVCIKHKIKDNLELAIDYHSFLSSQRYYIETSNMKAGKYLATEIDILMRKKIDRLKFEFGYSILKGTKNLSYHKAGDYKKLNHWCYLMLTYTPVFSNT